MPRNFEGNLAKNAANDASEQPSESKMRRSSGMLAKDKWKELEGVSADDAVETELDDILEKPEYEQVSSDVLQPDEDEYEQVNSDVLEEDSAQMLKRAQKKLGINTSSGENNAEEALDDLARSDRRSEYRSMKRAKNSPSLAEVADVGKNLGINASKKRNKIDALTAMRADLGPKDMAHKKFRRDVAAGRIPKPPSEVAKEQREEQRADFEQFMAEIRAEKERVMDELRLRIAEREANIKRDKKSTEELVTLRALIESQHAKDMELLQKEYADLEVAAKAEHEANIEFLNSAEGRQIARESVAGEIEAIRNEEPASVEMNEDGEVIGIKNIPLIDWNSFRYGMAGRMEAIKNETLLLLEQPATTTRNARLKALERESAKWMEMYRDGRLMEENGIPTKDAKIGNKLYRQVETVIPEGMNKTEAETLAITPEAKIDKDLEFLAEQTKRLDVLIQQAGEMIWAAADQSQKSSEKFDLAAHMRAMDEFLKIEAADDDSEIAYLELLSKPQHLDLHSTAVEADATRLYLESKKLREMLGSTKDRDMREQLQSNIDDLEGRMVEVKKDLESWKQNPIREEAMRLRQEELQTQIRMIEFGRERRNHRLMVHTAEGLDFSAKADSPYEVITKPLSQGRVGQMERIETEAQKKQKEAMAELQLAKDRLFGLMREKAQMTDEIVALEMEKIARETGIYVELGPDEYEYDIDLSELNASIEQAKKQSPDIQEAA